MESRLHKPIFEEYVVYGQQRMSRTQVKLEDLALDSNRFMRIPKRQLSILDNMRLEFKI